MITSVNLNANAKSITTVIEVNSASLSCILSHGPFDNITGPPLFGDSKMSAYYQIMTKLEHSSFYSCRNCSNNMVLIAFNNLRINAISR